MTANSDVPEHDFGLSITGPELPAGARTQLERWFWFTLGKFEANLGQVEVRLTPAEADADDWFVCRIIISDREGSVTLIEGGDRELAGCIRRTFRRAERSVRRLANPIRRRAPLTTGHAA